MIQDILDEIQEVDLLVATSVGKTDGKTSADDVCLHLVHRGKGGVRSYFCMPLDTCNIEYEKQILYGTEGDVDYCSEVETDDDDKVVGYLQFRRATMAERMMFFQAYAYNRGYFHEIEKEYNLPNALTPGSDELADLLYKKPMTIVFEDYA